MEKNRLLRNALSVEDLNPLDCFLGYFSLIKVSPDYGCTSRDSSNYQTKKKLVVFL